MAGNVGNNIGNHHLENMILVSEVFQKILKSLSTYFNNRSRNAGIG